MLERFGHGGDWATAEESFGKPEAGWLDYSANMNPAGPPACVEAIFRERWRDIARYPDPAVRGLRRKLAETHGISEESILVGNGAAELIDLAVRGVSPREAALAQPSFAEYGDALRKAGVRTKELLLAAGNGFELTAEMLAGLKLSEGSCVFIGHPNNPTGRLVPADALAALRTSRATLLIDEAFIDFVPGGEEASLLREAASSERIVVFRSMTKFYAIPGIRLGFVVAHPKLIARLRELQPPWSVNFLAQHIGEALLGETDYAAKTMAWLAEERPRLVAGLESLGLAVVPSEVNYLLVSLPEDSPWNAKKLQRRMAGRGILIRDASLFAGLDGRYFRLAVRLRHENERLLAELAAALKEGAGCDGEA
ncbi:threonine-phosphate decarboxylase CobD [Cohnella massiliensis]|uniref:threonine-phosphate decarboxylase CobD n=1 Tax=Cohnella massiliensis TaxID=1816691 RepID=UPI0009BC1707|nr:threonine-phosphate decarboxylase CobD [Cohnella massiliensis]